MTIDYIAVAVATITQFIVGAVWYMPLFGARWAKIHGFDALSPEEQAKAQKQMLPLLIAQFLVTLITAAVFVYLRSVTLIGNDYLLAFLVWLGFVAPTQVGAVLFGGTPPQWVREKILITCGGSLATLLSLAFVLSFF